MCKYKQVDQWNRIENLKIYPHICGPLIYDEGGTAVGKGNLFNKWSIGYLSGKKWNLTNLTPYSQIILRYIRDKNDKDKPCTFKMVEYLHYLEIEKDFSNRIQKVLSTKEEITKSTLKKEKLSLSKGISEKMQKQATEWRYLLT